MTSHSGPSPSLSQLHISIVTSGQARHVCPPWGFLSPHPRELGPRCVHKWLPGVVVTFPPSPDAGVHTLLWRVGESHILTSTQVQQPGCHTLVPRVPLLPVLLPFLVSVIQHLTKVCLYAGEGFPQLTVSVPGNSGWGGLEGGTAGIRSQEAERRPLLRGSPSLLYPAQDLKFRQDLPCLLSPTQKIPHSHAQSR